MTRKALLATITVVVSTVVALIIGELFLVVYSSQQTGREHMDPGLIRYHSRYGWNLTPGWQGKHSHPDYEVSYRIDRFGFREAQGAATSADSLPLTLVVGDSFTFGLGVGNEETYVARLNEPGSTRRYLNAAVPGYSPEQALLKAEDLVRIYKPDSLLFVIYLGNDLVDLGLPFPVQAEFAKPYASMNQDQWQLLNLPVPKMPKPAELKRRTLASYIIEPDSESWLTQRKLGQLLRENGFVTNRATLNREQVSRSLALMGGILDRLATMVDVDTTVLLLPGSGPVDRPGSMAARYQRQISHELVELIAYRQMKALPLLNDLAGAGTGLYFPLDGHLTARGHEIVARLVSTER